MATRLRELVITKYRCPGFTAAREGNTEITISYWESEDHLRSWKQDSEYLAAQTLGRIKWYKSDKVQVVEVVRECRNT
jgi:heme-degrading monooxygenase HmoA